jgi:hypothetical protein
LWWRRFEAPGLAAGRLFDVAASSPGRPGGLAGEEPVEGWPRDEDPATEHNRRDLTAPDRRREGLAVNTQEAGGLFDRQDGAIDMLRTG